MIQCLLFMSKTQKSDKKKGSRHGTVSHKAEGKLFRQRWDFRDKLRHAKN